MRIRVLSIYTLAVCLCLLLATKSFAASFALDFQSLQHGEVVTTQFQSSHGVTISATNDNSSHPDLAIIFDSSETGTRDPDLEGPAATPWPKGNLGANTVLGNMLVIAENNWGINNVPVGVLSHPDDEAGGGSMTFIFTSLLTSFGFTAVDIEGPSSIGSNNGYSLEFYLNSLKLGEVGYGEFVDNSSQYYVPGTQFGDHSANKIDPITIAQLGTSAFNKIVVNFGESGSIDNLVWNTVDEPPLPIPEPMTLLLSGMSLLGMYVRRRVKK